MARKANESSAAGRSSSSAPSAASSTVSLDVLADADLLALARDGDRAALATLASRHQRTIERMLSRFRVDPCEREELVQDAWVQIVHKAHTFRGDSQFSTWLYRVATNAALMRLRSRRRKHAESLDAIEPRAESLLRDHPWLAHRASLTPDSELATQQRRERVARALAALPDSYRALVIEHYLGDEPLQSIANRFETTESSVRSKLHRARMLLRGELSDIALDAAA